MIVFDLRCESGHVFEAWFGSSGDYEDQRERSLLACPICGDANVGKAVMAPAIGAKANKGMPSDASAKAMLHALAAAQAKALEGSTWVGPSFAERARAMHDGAEPTATIHGQATREEAKSLIEDGVSVSPLPFPVPPPSAVN